MAVKDVRKSPAKYVLRLMPALHANAKKVSASEGVSLNQFINIAVAEKLAHLEHLQWMARRKAAGQPDIEAALAILNRAGNELPASWDKIPSDYQASHKITRSVLDKAGSTASLRKKRG
jgi:hypothetical protein